MTGGEHQPQQIIADIVIQRFVQDRNRVRCIHRDPMRHFRQFVGRHCPVAELVNGPTFRRLHQPGTRIVRHPRLGPCPQRGHQRILRQFFGHRNIAHHAREPRYQARALDWYRSRCS